MGVKHFDLLTCLLTSASPEAGAESPEERVAAAAAAGVLAPARGAAKLLGWLRAGVSAARAARIASATRGNHVGSRLPKRSRAACGRVSNSVSRYVLLSEKVTRAPRLARYAIPRRGP